MSGSRRTAAVGRGVRRRPDDSPVNRGLTLIELLVVIAVILILATLLVPAVMRSRDSARKAACANNLKQLAAAVHQFHGREGSMPAYWGSMKKDADGLYGGWLLHLLPDLGQQTLYDSLPRMVQKPRLEQVQDVLVSAEVPASPDYHAGDWVEERQDIPQQVVVGSTTKEVTETRRVQVGTTTREVTETRQVQVGTAIKEVTEIRRVQVGTTPKQITERVQVRTEPKQITERVQVGTAPKQITEQVQVGVRSEAKVNFLGFTYYEEVPVFESRTRTIEEPVYEDRTRTIEEPVYEDRTRTIEEPVYEDQPFTRRSEEPVYESQPYTRTVEVPIFENQPFTKTVEVPVYDTQYISVWKAKLVGARGTPPQPAVYDWRWKQVGSFSEPGIPPSFGAAQQQATFPVLQCLSDPSEVPAGGKVAIKNPGGTTDDWSLTNYQANAHAWIKFGGVPTAVAGVTRGPGGRILSTITSGSTMGGRFPRAVAGPGATVRPFAHHDVITAGATANGLRPRRFEHLLDGTSNTILFGEGMRQCDGGNSYRAAFLPTADGGNEHAFGIDPSVFDPTSGAMTATLNAIYGGYGNTLMFQMRPGVRGCNKLRLQANHEDVLNVAMADGSVRGISATVSRREQVDPDVAGRTYGADTYHPAGMGGKPGYADGVWDMLLLPTDGAEGQVLTNSGEVGAEK